MFSTPTNSETVESRVRRAIFTAASRLNSNQSQTGGDADRTGNENPIANESNSNSEVLTILRSLQQQVSAMQAQQQDTHGHSQEATCTQDASGSPSTSARSTPSSVRNRLPRDLVSTVHQVIRQFKERDDDPLEWNTGMWYVTFLFDVSTKSGFPLDLSNRHNSKVTAEIISTVTNEKFSSTMVRRAARTYFLTLQRRFKRVTSGHLTNSQKKQRKIQRKHNKLRHRRSACLASTSLSQEDKEKYLKIIMLDYMSSEETGSESGSGSEIAKKKIFITKPISWRSGEVNNIMESLDRKVLRRRSERAKEMRRTRRVGQSTSRSVPENQPSWAVTETPVL